MAQGHRPLTLHRALARRSLSPRETVLSLGWCLTVCPTAKESFGKQKVGDKTMEFSSD